MEEKTGRSLRRLKSPEELEVEKLQKEIEDRKERIVELELEIETLKRDLASFQAEVDRRLGPLYVELDRLALRRRRYEARIERLKKYKKQGRKLNPETIEKEIDEQFQKEWEELREKQRRAEASAQQAPEPLSLDEKEELQRVYRKLVRRFHPDLAESEAERERNHRIMIEINQAYAEGDLHRLKLLEAKEFPEEAPLNETVGEKLVRLIRRRYELDQAIGRLEGKREELRASKTYQLMQRVKEEAEQGNDLFAEWEGELEEEIARAREELAEVIQNFKDRVVEVFWGRWIEV